MLGKLIKQEFRATGRLMAPLFGALLLLALVVRANDLVFRHVESHSAFLNILNTLLIIAYVLALIGVMVFSTVLMIKRFHQNFLTDEGYLMFTLPAGVHSLLWSKLITAALFFIFTFLAEALAVAIVVWRGGLAREMFTGFADFFRRLDSYYMANGLAFALETLALLFVALLVTCLLFYAPMSIGYSFANHKGLLSVVFYFVIQAVLQICGVLVLAGIADEGSVTNTILRSFYPNPLVIDGNPHAVVQVAHGAMLLTLLVELVIGAVLYFLTYFMLRKHRNLQ